MTEKVLTGFVRLPFWLQWMVFAAFALLLYIPIVNNSFVNDDFSVIKKVCFDKQLNTDGFFRPLSDITLFFNYRIGGIDPSGYYLFNIFIHALDAVLLFHFCRLWKWTEHYNRQLLTAGIASLLFLTYPFHSESIVWILGRASLLGNTFGMLALVIMVSRWHAYARIAGACLCYFIGLSGYESVIMLPVIIFIWLISQHASVKQHALWIFCLTVTLLLHMWLRITVSGSVTGDYGSGLFRIDVLIILANTGKVAGRLFLPPMNSNIVIICYYIVLAVSVSIGAILLWKKIRAKDNIRQLFLALAAMLLVSLLLPFYFGISTHTSESDRFLHFPSFFLCFLLSFFLVMFVERKAVLSAAVVILLIYFTVFLQVTNQNWRKASGAVRSVLAMIKKHSNATNIYVINLPGEIDGAYVFRVGFKDALYINRMNRSKVTVVNQEKRDSLIKLPPVLLPEQKEDAIFIPPQVYVCRNSGSELHPVIQQQPCTIWRKKDDIVVYWNKNEWKIL